MVASAKLLASTSPLPLAMAVLLTVVAVCAPSAAQHEDNIRAWAEELGDELWRLGRIVTKFTDMKKNYQYHNVQVHEKDGTSLLESIVKDVSRMLARKVEAVKCIMMAAEEVAEEFEYNSTAALGSYTYRSAKYSTVHEEGATEPFVPEFSGKPEDRIYDDMYLGPDPHFYNIPVNTTHSCVHVPTNVFDKAVDVLPSIVWSEGLDHMFIKNYESDPSLSWQFFGLSTGVMRSYPAFHWKQEVDVFDCRTRFWFIEAATCTKDMVVLLDNTGSMRGIRQTIARLTVHSILDTLGNNDFVNVFYFNSTLYDTVPCFKKTLVQATLENKNMFKNQIQDLKTFGSANFSQVFVEAFEILEQYRQERGCGDDDEGGARCNQAIMLITDGIPGNLTDVFERYNRKNNNTHIPVRIFSFLVGREVTKVREIQWLACLNRGYYVHIHHMTEVREQVLKYIDVIARPLVLQGVVHPVVWTHAYADTSDPKIAAWLRDVMDSPEKIEQLLLHERNKGLYFSQQKEDSLYIKEGEGGDDEEAEPQLQAYRLMTSVAIPAFDTKANRNTQNRTAKLLGVAGTDVSLDDIERRASSFKIGVNGYPFIVTNNGYILIHPDLRPVFRGVLKDNYNSVDFSEVEITEEDVWARESNTSSALFKLREAIVSHTVGSRKGLRMKYHYDDMKRVAVENKDYFYAPLTGTPFTMGIALPQGYGYFKIGVGDVLQTIRQQGIPVTTFFSGSNWKIHPDWLYCKYNHDSYKAFTTSEEELLHFLQKMSSEDWKWFDQYEDVDDDVYESWKSLNHSANCSRQPVEEGSYYCDKDLLQLLLFDAEVTEPFFRDEKWIYRNKVDKELVDSYKVTLRFVATHSGLTRWEHVEENEESIASGMEFGDLHTHGIEEPWYKSAVLQHQINQDSFVFSVPFAAGDDENTSVTASYAVFPRDGGREAPASVVGLQFRHSSLRSRFFSITGKKHCATCTDTCTSGEFDCYILDSNGYVIVSERKNDTGKFFGEIDGGVFETMKFNGIFKKLRMFDYQSLCFEEILEIMSAANMLFTPLHHVGWLLDWLLGQVLWFLVQSFHVLFLGDWTSSFPLDTEIGQEYYPDYYVLEEERHNDTLEDDLEELGQSSEEKPLSVRLYNTSRPCDEKSNLYLLQQQEDILQNGVYKAESPINGARPFSVRLIPHTNLLLLVIDDLRQGTQKRITVARKEIRYNNTEYPCQKTFLNGLPRRRLLACYSEHPEEVDIKTCGDSNKITCSTLAIMVCWIIASIFHLQH
ncbi:voltage-dependent calcium channel subunit alpha-2/delta-4 [Bacillus rossius redtenbacheri]|uniref:voltage-dependent calcium channel subunit alpha-2/delta-4 n=1 Tax=Bacillus rossius redtenbacheri TaxID=93214 RepID=UPI002FDD6DFB